MYLTSNVKFLRKRKNRTQDDVAVALNMKRSTLSGYENGVAEPAIDILVSLSKYYGVAIDTLLPSICRNFGEPTFRAGTWV